MCLLNMCGRISMLEVGAVDVLELLPDDMIGNENEWHRLE